MYVAELVQPVRDVAAAKREAGAAYYFFNERRALG